MGNIRGTKQYFHGLVESEYFMDSNAESHIGGWDMLKFRGFTGGSQTEIHESFLPQKFPVIILWSLYG